MKNKIRVFLFVIIFIHVLILISCQDNTTDPDTTGPVIEPTPYDTMDSGEWHYLGLDGVRISDLKVDPFDRNIIFAGMASNFSAGQTGKLFRSMDGGFTWDTLLTDINLTYIDISKLTPGKVIVTGSKNFLNPMYLLKTMDYGESWTDIPMPPLNVEEGIVRCKMSPNDDRQLYIQVIFPIDGKFYRSENEGLLWQLKPYLESDYLPIFEYDFNPYVPNEIVLLIMHPPYLLLSENSCDSYIALNSPIEYPYSHIRYNPFKANQIVLQDHEDGIFLSNDKGETWFSLDLAVNDTTRSYDLEFLHDSIVLDKTNNLHSEILRFDFNGNLIESIGAHDSRFYEMNIECYSNIILIGSNGVYVHRI